MGNPVGRPFFCGLRNLLHEAELATEFALLERHAAIDEREQGMVGAHAHVDARIELRAALTHKDVAGDAFLPTELLDAEATTGRVTTIARRAACFLMCHVE